MKWNISQNFFHWQTNTSSTDIKTQMSPSFGFQAHELYWDNWLYQGKDKVHVYIKYSKIV